MSEAATNPNRVGHPRTAQGQIFARDRRLPASAPLFYLRIGGKAAAKGDVDAGHLICPIPDCPRPNFTVRAGSRRDHFAHRPGAHGHGAETLLHYTGKHLVARWLGVGCADAVSIHVDGPAVDGGGIPDVLLGLPAGVQVAYEVQCAAMTVEQWIARHDRYREHGVRDVWLFAGRRYVRKPRYAVEEHEWALPPLLQAVAGAGQPVLLLDVDGELLTLGFGRTVRSLLAGDEVYGDETLDAAWMALPDVPLSHGLPDVPGWRQMRDGALRAREMRATEAAARQAWLATPAGRAQTSREEAARRDFAERVRQQQAQELARQEAEAAKVAARRSELEQSAADLRADVERRWGPVPSVCDVGWATAGELDVMRMAPWLWRWRLLLGLTGRVGHPIHRTWLGLLMREYGVVDNKKWTHADAFLASLQQSGWVWQERPKSDWIVVLADLRSPPAPALAEAIAGGRTGLSDGTLEVLDEAGDTLSTARADSESSAFQALFAEVTDRVDDRIARALARRRR